MKKLRRYRREKGLSQTELAEAIGVNQSNICRWERGGYLPNAAQVAALIRIFERSEAELFEDEV